MKNKTTKKQALEDFKAIYQQNRKPTKPKILTVKDYEILFRN